MNVKYMQRREKWIEALESGDYNQGSACLRRRRDDAFCCLGVACDIYDDTKWRDNGVSFVYIADEPIETALSYKMMDYYGLSIEMSDELIHANDARKASFKQIADMIRGFGGPDN